METKESSAYHLVGVGGVGMSALAQLLLLQGARVSGSDRSWDQAKETETLRKLRDAGLRRFPQDGSGINADLSAVIYSTAIEDDNRDRRAALKHNIPFLHRAELLARLVGEHPCIAVTGTSGKTTVTGMIGWILERVGLDPTVVNGGEVINWTTEKRLGSVRMGTSNLWVIEADESDRSLLRFQPAWTVVTNISRDHFNLTDTVKLFQRFCVQTRAGLVCSYETGKQLEAETGEIAYIAKTRALHHIRVDEKCLPTREGWSFNYAGSSFDVPLPGHHNAENALLAVATGIALGAEPAQIAEALGRFRGIRRRLETICSIDGITVIDDYAHNPAKIRAAWSSVDSGPGRILGVWRPHGFGPLAAMLTDLVKTLGEVMHARDHLFVLPVFYAGGSAKREVSSSSLVTMLRSKGLHAVFTADYDDLVRQLCETARADDIILSMGARDPQLPLFARRLCRELSSRDT